MHEARLRVSPVIRMALPGAGRRALRALAATVLALALLGAAAPAAAQQQDAATLWRALRSGGHVALMRHALAPGTGDPAGFRLGDCSTQRNLSEEGQRQAARIGERFRDNGIDSARVLSSQWCRCEETARLLALGPVSALPALNSFFQQTQFRDSRTGALRQWLVEQDLSRPTVLVTHQVNINALTNTYTTSGEIVVVRVGDDGRLAVLGSIRPES